MKLSRLLGAAGFTVVEVLITLTVAGVILISSIALLNGRQAQASFQLALRDLNSELTNKIKDVKSGRPFIPAQYICSYDSSINKVKVTAYTGPPPAPEQGSNSDCIVLGKAFWVQPTSGKISIYTVLSCRFVNCDSTTTPPNPVRAFNNTTISVNRDIDLTETYRLNNAARIISSKVQKPPWIQRSDLIAYYTNLSNTAVSGNASSLIAFGYVGYFQPFTSLSNTLKCLERNLGFICSNPPDVSLWRLCLASNYTSQFATIDITSSAKGIKSYIKYGSCN